MHAGLVLGQVGVGLEGGVDGRRVERPGRALRVDREGADALDLVAPELDAQRVAERRVDVDQAAAHGELAAVAHLVLEALVAEVGEAADDDVEAGRTGLAGRRLLADRERDRPRLQLERHEALEQGHGLGDDDPAGGERGERLLALADDVRRRRHVGAVEHAARRQHRHLAAQVDLELGGQLRRRLAVRRHDEPARAGGASVACGAARGSSPDRRRARTARSTRARRPRRRGAAAAPPPRTSHWSRM